MKIPSYDDLTRPIPDAARTDTVLSLGLFVDTPAAAERAPQGTALVTAPSALFACVYGVEVKEDAVRWTADAMTVARTFSPRVAAAGARTVIVDVSGLGRLIGPPPVIAAEIDRAAREAGLDVRVALAPTQTAARLLAIGCPSRMVVTGERLRPERGAESPRACERGWGPASTEDVAAALAPLPVTLAGELETLPDGMTARDRARPYETLSRWGIATLGDLAALPSAELSSRLGRRGLALQRLARGCDPCPFVPDAETPRYRERLELEWPIDALEPLSFVLARLLEPLSAALERADRGAAAVRLDLRLINRSTHARMLQLPAPIRDPRVLRTLLLLDLESHPPDAAIDVVAIEADPAPARVTQFSLLERARPSTETVATLLARLGALVGEDRVGCAALVDTHAPGAFEMRRFELPPATPSRAPHAASAPPLRRCRPPVTIRVRVDRGRPVHVAAPRRGQPSGAVVDAAGPWRTSGAWWLRSRWNRDEWDVAIARQNGAICRIFRDRDTDRWFLDGVYD
jgi:protein ImuB